MMTEFDRKVGCWWLYGAVDTPEAVAEEFNRLLDKVVELEHHNAALIQTLDETAKAVDHRRLNPLHGHHITHEQIDAATAVAKRFNCFPTNIVWQSLIELGIKRCEECGGDGLQRPDWPNTKCPACNGHGWTKGGE